MKNRKIMAAVDAADRAAAAGAQNLREMAMTVVRAVPAVGVFLSCTTVVLADGNTEAATEAIKSLLNVLYLITNVIGVIFVLVGFVRIVIAHAQEDGPGQQKAAMFIGTGIALILLRIFMTNMHPETWINTSTS